MASRYTAWEAGVTSSRTPGAMVLPRNTFAAISRSSSWPLAHDPMNAWSILCRLSSDRRQPVTADRARSRDVRLQCTEIDPAYIAIGGIGIGLSRNVVRDAESVEEV